MNSNNFTIGIEEEYMICDPITGDLVDRANQIMGMIPNALQERFSYELLLSEIESNTSISESVSNAVSKLAKNRNILNDIGEKLDYKIGISGTHPTANPNDQSFVKNESYNWVSENLKYYASQNITFALHVHVGFENNEELIHVANGMRRWVAPLLFLSCNSPFFNSSHTGFRSSRSMQFGLFPRTGYPPKFSSYADFSELIDVLINIKGIAKPRHLWWKLRPHTDFGTLEFRMFDAQREFGNIEMLASLAQALSYVALSEYKENNLVEDFNLEILNDSLWKAIRYGGEAFIYDQITMAKYTLKDFVKLMVDYATPGLKFFNNYSTIKQVDRILEHGTEGDKQYFYFKNNNNNFDCLKHYIIDNVENSIK